MSGSRLTGACILVVALATLIVIPGCQPLPPKTSAPTIGALPTADVAPQVTATKASTVQPVSSPTSAASPAALAVVAATATAMPIVVAEEEDCMAGCHPPDPNEHIADGAVVQPVSHVGRTTCLTCHASPSRPALPASHLGRMDPSCAVCHKPPQ